MVFHANILFRTHVLETATCRTQGTEPCAGCTVRLNGQEGVIQSLLRVSFMPRTRGVLSDNFSEKGHKLLEVRDILQAHAFL